MHATDDATRKAFITGLRDLADYLTDHPDVPVPAVGRELTVYAPRNDAEASRREFVDRVATALGVTADRDLPGHYQATRAFGPMVTYAASTTFDAARAEYEARTSYEGCIIL